LLLNLCQQGVKFNRSSMFALSLRCCQTGTGLEGRAQSNDRVALVWRRRQPHQGLCCRAARQQDFSVDPQCPVPLLPHGKGQVGEIAPRLGLSQRTFARRLSLEGLTFSEVLERLRFDLAERYLADDGLSISQIAWLLGYREVSAFTHAFKRSPGAMRRLVRRRP
jgi:AraC-like DNA-binding protein